jgi:hypothetical protein
VAPFAGNKHSSPSSDKVISTGAPHIANLAEWRGHILERLKRQITITGDPCLSHLLQELSSYSVPACESATGERDFADIIVPLEFDTNAGRLSFFSTISVFGTPSRRDEG